MSQDMATLETNAAAALAAFEKAKAGIAQLVELHATDGEAFEMLKARHDELEAAYNAAEAKLTTAKQSEAIKAAGDPLIKAIGSVKVTGEGKGIPSSVKLSDIPDRIKKAEAALEAAKGTLAVFTKIQNAVEKTGLDAAVIDQLGVLHVTIAEGEAAFELGKPRRSGGGGTRVRSGLERITGANDAFAGYIGKTVGKDGETAGDFASWRAVLEAVDKAKFDDLETKRKAGSNYSASVALGRKAYGFTSERIA